MGNKKIQLFVFPYAGGSVASMKRLTDLLSDSIDVITVEYSGRGTRSREPLANSFDSLLGDAISFCLGRRNDSIPYAVLGYSMGSIMAYEMMRRSMESPCQHLFLCAEVSPKDRALELRQIHNPTDENVLDRARKLGGVDDRLVNNKRFYDIYIRPMLSDYKHFFTYRFNDIQELVKSDVTFMYCEQDTEYKDVKKWEELIVGTYEYFEMGNNHFFINQCYEKMADIINSKLIL